MNLTTDTLSAYLATVAADLASDPQGGHSALVTYDAEYGLARMIGDSDVIDYAYERDRESTHIGGLWVLAPRAGGSFAVEQFDCDVDGVETPDSVTPEQRVVYVAQGPGLSVGQSVLLGVFVDDMAAMNHCNTVAGRSLDWIEAQRGDFATASPWRGGWRADAGTRRHQGQYTLTAMPFDTTNISANVIPSATLAILRAQDLADHPHDADCPRCSRRQWDDGEPATCRACGFVMGSE